MRIKGFGVTVEVPDRAAQALKKVLPGRTRGAPAPAAGELVLRPVPPVAYEPRDPAMSLAPTDSPPADAVLERATGDTVKLAREVARHDWYHTIELPGVVTPGAYDHRPLVPSYGIPDDLAGRRVLDVGTADGFWAFEFERRGAKVTAVDVATTADLDIPEAVRRLTLERGIFAPLGGGFALAHRALDSTVERIVESVYELDPVSLGRFDLVHAGDLLVHLRDPVRALERMRDVTAGEALFSDVFDPRLGGPDGPDESLVRYLGGWKMAGWWTPSLGALVQMVADGGFREVEVLTTYRLSYRGRSDGPWRALIRARP